MRTLLEYIRESRFGQATLILSLGAVLPQAINILFYPLLTRLYSPNEFGIFATISSLIAILGTVVGWRYELAIPLAKDRETGVSLLMVSLVAVVLTVLALSVCLWVGDKLDWLALLHPAFATYAWVFPLALLGTGFAQSLIYGALWLKRFGLITRIRFIQSLGQGLIQVVGGVLGVGVLGLLLGFVLAKYLGFLPLLRALPISRGDFIPKRWLEAAIRYREFPLYNAWAALLDAVGNQLPVILIAKFFSTADAGQLSLAMRILALPSLLIGQGLSQAFYPWAAECADRPELLRERMERLSGALLISSLGLFGVIAVVAPFLFSWLFGDAWSLAGHYTRYLTPWLLFNFVSSPLSTIVLVKQKQKWAFFFTIYEASLRVLAVWLGYLGSSATLSVFLFGLAGAFISAVYLLWELYLAGVSIKQWFSQLWFFLAAGGFSVLVMIYLEPVFSPAFLGAAAVVILGGFSVWALVRWLR